MISPKYSGRNSVFRLTLLAACVAFVAVGCEKPTTSVEGPIAAYRDRMLVEQAEQAKQERTEHDGRLFRDNDGPPSAQLAGSTQEETRRESLMTEAATTQKSPGEVLDEIPDPIDAEAVFQRRLNQISAHTTDQRVAKKYERVIQRARELLDELRRPEVAKLTLSECIQRALEHNYSIRIEAYNPAISRESLIEAEAAFDAVFFLDSSYSDIDQPTASQLAGNQTDLRNIKGGFRKLLPSGMRVETSIGQGRTYTDLQFATLNPSYETTFTASFTQPVLKGFGLDYNRAAINIRRADFRIARETFIQKVRDTLLDVETAYWRLSQSRRSAMILAESVAQNYDTWQSMWARRDHDVSPVEIANSESRYNSRLTEYLEAVKTVRDAEDALKNLINDPDLLLSRDIEIVPTEVPFASPITVDQFAEVRTAIDGRSEIRSARERIEQTRVQTMVAKNETMPQLDVGFQYEVQGLGPNGDVSLDKLTTNRFRSYTVSLNFSYPIGNRKARASLRKARNQESQALVGLQQLMDGVVQEVNAAVRTLVFRYRQVPTQVDAVQNADRTLRALQARTDAITPSFLETELSNIEQLANTRRVLLTVITEYNIAIIALEKAKGTLLEYNNITIAE